MSELFDNLPVDFRRVSMAHLGETLSGASLETAMQAQHLEAWETDPWVPPALLQVECLPRWVIDPCAGKGAWAEALMLAGFNVETVDIVDWTRHFEGVRPVDHVADFLSMPDEQLQTPQACGRGGFAAVMNPPFSGDDDLLACAFVDRALRLGARKVVCFQRFAWRESARRAAWWAANPPARIWLCIDRTTCWRFDVPDTCNGTCDSCCGADERLERKQRGLVNGCRKCLGNTPSAHAVYVWERGHKGAEMIHELRKAR